MQPISVPATLDSLAAIAKYIVAAGSEAGLDKKRNYSLRLAVDEIATNVILHGYQEAGLEGAINLWADLDEHALTVSLEDTGAAYDPTLRPLPPEEDFTKPLDQRELGGRGVYLAIQSVDKFIYRRFENRNRNVFVMNRATHGRLLVVDDRKENRDLLSGYLTDLGYSVVLAADGRQALSLLKRQKVDLVLIDAEAPGLNAYQWLEQVKADNALRGIPVIALSTPEAVQAAEKCIEMGADDYILEPFSAVVLKARVSAHLEKQRVRVVEEALRQSEKLERDLQIGRQIQLSFLPEALPQLPGWEIAAHFEPAQEVAGDFYDAFLLPNNRLGLVLGDVCDKGVGAALFMALFRSLIRAFAQQYYVTNLLDNLGNQPATSENNVWQSLAVPSVGTLSLQKAIELTNSFIITNHTSSNMFATVFFASLDPASGALIYINGGHPPAILNSKGVQTRLVPTGPAVGIIPGSRFEIRQAQLDPGDTLLMYSDGVTEAWDTNHKLFTEKRLLSLYQQADSSAAALLSRINSNLHAHMAGSPQHDDITMLAIRRAPAVEIDARQEKQL